MKKCKVCNQLIPEGRLKAIPGTQVCTAHSNATAYIANVVGIGDPEDDHYQEIDIIRDPNTISEFKNYQTKVGQYKN